MPVIIEFSRCISTYSSAKFEYLKQIRIKRELQIMDDVYYLTGQSSFSLFPPSFYHTHTPEEIERITQEEIAKIMEIINHMDSTDEH